MWVAIHKCMEAVLGISLYRYLYPKLTKTICLSIVSYVFSSTKLEKKSMERVLSGSGGEGGRIGGGEGGGGRSPKQCIHM
jgi:hypothetical protein